jgi:ribosome maturation factor RimP
MGRQARFCLWAREAGEGLVVSQDLQQRLLTMIEPVLAGLGYELVDLQLALARAGGQLRLFIDRDAGVNIEDCERVSHAVSALLDAADPIPVPYTLEVSTPGLDRVLRTPQHFARYAGKRVHVELVEAQAGRRRYTGQLQAVGDDGVELEVDGQAVLLKFSAISRAHVVPQWPARGAKG